MSSLAARLKASALARGDVVDVPHRVVTPDQATPALTPLQQFDLTLPRQGRRALFRASNKSNTFFDTNEELLAECQRLVDEPGVYMAVCSFGAEDKRTQANAQFCRSLYIDIDAGAEKYARAPTKAYPDAKDALAALVAFCKTIDLKPSLIISSGMGLHVYWVLDDDYPTAAVRPVMDKLKQACAVLDLRADPNVTADTARVLRPVGSLHSKDSDGTERRVTAIKITDAVHSLSDVALKMLPYAPQDATPKIDLPNINDDILTYPDNDHSLAKGLEHCGALKEIADAGGNVPEPFWRLMLGVAKACNVDGSEIAHKVSENDPRYDAANLDGYLDRWTTGPALCTSFAEHSSACKGCPHNGRIKSPIVLCRVDGPITTTAEVAPPPDWVATENQKTAVVRVGSSVLIASFDSPIMGTLGLKRGLAFLKMEAYRVLRRGTCVSLTLRDGSTKGVPLADAWLAHPQRRQYGGGMVFAPDGAVPDDVLNLWQGYAVESKAGDVGPWLHLLESLVVDPGLRAYVLRWLAFKVQRPGDIPDTVVVLSGAKGAGKNSLFDPIVAMIGAHAMVVDEPELIIGRFTVHLLDKVFVVIDEAVFTGDPRHDDRLKSRITAKTRTYEQKGVDPIQGVNRTAYVILTNHAHVWQSTQDERRAVIVECGDSLRGDFAFWDEFHRWAAGPGPAALLHYLLHVDLAGFNPRAIPKNDALRRQVELTALKDPAVAWWHGVLTEGAITARAGGDVRRFPLADDEPTEVDSVWLRDSFESSAGARVAGRSGAWALAMKKLATWCGPGGMVKSRPRKGASEPRAFVYTLPALRELKVAFEGATGVTV